MSNIALDQAGRDSIVKDLDKNLFVIAGAGSGKTSMLVARMVAMVESGIDISQICSITFTKKAAAEFLSRFQKKLKEGSIIKDGDSEEKIEKARKCKEALEKIDLCFTGTIDSFCNLVLSEYPNDAGIPSSSMVVEEDEFISLCKKEYEKIANDDNSPLRKEFLEFNQLVPNGADTFSRSIQDVIDYSHLDIKYPVPSKPLSEAVKDLSLKYQKVIQDDVKLLLSLESDVVIDEKSTKPQESFNALKIASSFILSDWNVSNFVDIKRVIRKVFCQDLRFNDQPSTKFFDFGPVRKVYKCLEKKESHNLKAYLDDVDKIVYSYSMHFLVNAANTIKKSLKEQGKLSFTEYLMTFRNMVIKDMDNGMKLIKHIRNKHSYFLIDESQDTSPAQTELFLYLCSEVEAHSLKECQPIPGSIFIVGDPKQSIYGFRGADVDAYLETKTLFESVYDSNYNKVVYLTRNFRSTYELKEYFNDKFATLANYEPIPLDQNNVPPSEIANDVLSGVFSSTEYLLAIKALVGKHYIYDSNLHKSDPSSLGKRLIEYRDIMLLTWSTTNHDKVMNLLKANNIPFYCEGRFGISETQIVEVIYAIYLYISGESGGLINLLSSPLFNAKPNDILSIKTIDDIPDGKEKDFILSVEPLKNIDNPVLLLETIIEKLKLFKYIDFANLEYALFVLETMKAEYTSLNVFDINSGISFLKDFLSTKLERCMNMEITPNAVNIANVHKVKGLEKPVVIIVGGISGANKPTKDSNYMNNEAYIFKTGAFDTGKLKLYDIECGALFTNQELIAEQKKEEEIERLCYVAVTRARNVLVLPPFSNDSRNPWKGIYFDNAQQIPYSDLPDVAVFNAGEFTFEEPTSFNDKNTYQEKSPSAEAHIFNKFSEEVEDVEETEEDTIDSRIKGTLVHRLMQKIVNSKGKLPKDGMIRSILDEFSLEDSSPYKAILENVYETMFNGGFPQINGVSADLLSILFKSECQCEVPFSYKNGYEIWQGEIDLVYVLNGQYYIVDYKTNSDETGLEDKYKKQLEAYKKILKKALGVDAITYIYHIDA